MKKLNKRVLDELIEVERNYWGMGLNDKELDRQARKAIDTAMDLECGWSCAVNLTTTFHQLGASLLWQFMRMIDCAVSQSVADQLPDGQTMA